MSLQRCMQETSSTDFIQWMSYLEKDTNAFHREDYYLAQIALEVRRSYVKSPAKVKMKDMILEFKRAQKAVDVMATSKAAWGACLNVKMED